MDVGCGTGALTHAILNSASPRRVLATDRSFEYLRLTRARAGTDRASYVVADATESPTPGATVDAAVSGLVLNFVPRPGRMVGEMARAVRPGGQVAVYVWDYADRMELIRYFWDVALTVDGAAAAFDEARRFPICRPQALQHLFEATGLTVVEVRSIDVPTVFKDFDDYWAPFLGGQGPAPAYAMSLSEPDRTNLRERLRSTLPKAADGSIPLVARAWAVRGSVATAIAKP